MILEDCCFVDAFNGQFDGPSSSASLIVESGPGVMLSASSGTIDVIAGAETKLQLRPLQFAVIGRQHGGQIEYLDERCTPTHLVPNTGQSVLTQNGRGPDTSVSRGHFTLHAAGRGLVLVNGVPRRGGGIRPPINGTWILCPTRRFMSPGEEFLIEPGVEVKIMLPNSTVICIRADGMSGE